MRHQYPLFQSHLDLAHHFWEQLLTPHDTAIDATCGNGYDTLFLSSLLLEGKIYALDIQESAICATKKKLQHYKNIEFSQQCHSSFPPQIAAESVQLISYNLGYLPGANKEVTTKVFSTIASIQKGQLLLAPGGLISIVCYPGHPEGKEEEKELQLLLANLPPQQWAYTEIKWPNRNAPPSLILLQKSLIT